MTPIQHGTCGDEHRCRYGGTTDGETIQGMPQIQCHHTGTGGIMDATEWCEHWEPPEGLCCGNCELSVSSDVPSLVCQINEHYHQWADGCDRWRWQGPGGEE